MLARAAVEPHGCARLPGNAPKVISCIHSLPEGSLSALLGRHSAMNPAGMKGIRRLRSLG
jgi:hypothetical protein